MKGLAKIFFTIVTAASFFPAILAMEVAIEEASERYSQAEKREAEIRYVMEATIEGAEKRILREIMRSPALRPADIDNQSVLDQKPRAVIVTQLLGAIAQELRMESCETDVNDIYSLLMNLFGRIGYPTPHEMLAIINVHFTLTTCPETENRIIRALAKAYKHNSLKAIEQIYEAIPIAQTLAITDTKGLKQRIAVLSKTVMFCQALQKEVLKEYPYSLRSLAPYMTPVLPFLQNLDEPSAQMFFDKTRHFATFIMLDKMFARQFPHNALMLNPRAYCWLYGATVPFLLGGMCNVVFKPRVNLAYEVSKIFSYGAPLCIGLYWMAFPQLLKINNYLLRLALVHEREHTCAGWLKQLEVLLNKCIKVEQQDREIAQLQALIDRAQS